MGFWKVYIAVDCADEAEYRRVQEAAKEISNTRILKGGQILSMLKVFNENKEKMIELFQMISSGGIKSLTSAKGIWLIGSLVKKK